MREFIFAVNFIDYFANSFPEVRTISYYHVRALYIAVVLYLVNKYVEMTEVHSLSIHFQTKQTL